jgi:transposase
MFHIFRSANPEVAPLSWTPDLLNFWESTMARKHPPYAPEFRRQMIELVRAGRTPEDLAKEFEPSAQAIRNWIAQADRDEGRREDGLTTAEREELGRLRRENRQLKLEREILSKAAAWFARETDVIPPKGSNS